MESTECLVYSMYNKTPPLTHSNIDNVLMFIKNYIMLSKNITVVNNCPCLEVAYVVILRIVVIAILDLETRQVSMFRKHMFLHCFWGYKLILISYFIKWYITISLCFVSASVFYIYTQE